MASFSIKAWRSRNSSGTAGWTSIQSSAASGMDSPLIDVGRLPEAFPSCHLHLEIDWTLFI